MRILVPLLVVLGVLQGCDATTPRRTDISDHGQYQRGPISEVEAETLTTQLNEARTQRDSASNLRSTTNPEVRRKLQQAVYDYSQLIALYENRLRSAGRPY